MSEDIYLFAEDDKKLFPKDYYTPGNTERRKHRLSRIFCKFMCRKDFCGGEPELDQIGRLTSVDIQPLYEMESNNSGDYGADETKGRKYERQTVALLQHFFLIRH